MTALQYIRTHDVQRLLAAWDRRAIEAGEVNATAPMADVVSKLREELASANVDDGDAPDAEEPTLAATTWRERLWTCPPETRLNVSDLAEAMGRPKSWVYQQTSARSIPAHKLDGALVFVASEVREWLNDREEQVVAPLRPA